MGLKSEEIAILYIGTHGGHEDGYTEFTTPIDIEYISAVTPGVCNKLTEEVSDMFITTIKKNLKATGMTDIKAKTLGSIIKHKDPFYQKAKIDRKTNYYSKYDDDDKDYALYSRHAYNVSTYRTMSNLLNKTFIAYSHEKVEADTKSCFDSICLITMKNKRSKIETTDILTDINFLSKKVLREGKLTADLRTILIILKSKGFKRVIVVDTSCAVADGRKPRIGAPRDGDTSKESYGTPSSFDYDDYVSDYDTSTSSYSEERRKKRSSGSKKKISSGSKKKISSGSKKKRSSGSKKKRSSGSKKKSSSGSKKKSS